MVRRWALTLVELTYVTTRGSRRIEPGWETLIIDADNVATSRAFTAVDWLYDLQARHAQVRFFAAFSCFRVVGRVPLMLQSLRAGARPTFVLQSTKRLGQRLQHMIDIRLGVRC